MASSKQRLLDHIGDITECPICKAELTNPKMLPCVHAFCLACLVDYGNHEENDKPGDQVACPLCRANFVIPPRGFAYLPDNFFVNKLLLANQIQSPSMTVESQECDLCKEAHIQARVYCTECHKHLCEPCNMRHRIPNATKLHQVVSLKGMPRAELLFRMTASYYPLHLDKQIKVYCNDCKMVTCGECKVTKHSKHACSDVKESAEEFCKQRDNDIEKMTSCAQQSRDKLQKLESDNEGFLKNLAVTQQAMSAAYDKLKSLLDSHLSQLIEELKTIKTKRVKEIESKRDELESQCMVVESFKKYCEEMKEKGTACDISRAANDLHTRSTQSKRKSSTTVSSSSTEVYSYSFLHQQC